MFSGWLALLLLVCGIVCFWFSFFLIRFLFLLVKKEEEQHRREEREEWRGKDYKTLNDI